MRYMLSLVVFISFIGNISAQEKNAVKPDPDPKETVYCALLKDGAMIIVAEGKQVYQDIKLNDGFIIRSNAMLVNEEGIETPLVNGDCVGLDGKIIKYSGNKKPEKE